MKDNITSVLIVLLILGTFVILMSALVIDNNNHNKFMLDMASKGYEQFQTSTHSILWKKSNCDHGLSIQ